MKKTGGRKSRETVSLKEQIEKAKKKGEQWERGKM
jgi:hypothetical protein